MTDPREGQAMSGDAKSGITDPSVPAGTPPDWEAARRGMKLEVVSLQVVGVAMPVAIACYVLATILSRQEEPSLVGDVAPWLGGLCGLVSLVGMITALVGVLELTRVAIQTGASRLAAWGVYSVPVSLAVLALLFLAPNNRKATPVIFVLFVMVAPIVHLLCLTNILRAAASYWGGTVLARQFRLWFWAFTVFNVSWIGLTLGYAYGPDELRYLLRSIGGETNLMAVPVLLFGLLAWHVILVNRLRRRIPRGAALPCG
jgi:hypothetical protein